jgi:NDP-sugar pyrophosphorylase family protein
MKGIIIAGGFGTRLRPLTYDRPKHLLPVANRPFLEYQVALLKRHGVSDIIFATNYQAHQIEAHFGDGSRFGVTMRYALEKEPLGTAGAIRNAAALAPDETVLVFNGDILTDFDLSEIVQFHCMRGARATIALRTVERPHPFGALQTEPDGRVLSWHEPSDEEKRRVAENPAGPSGEHDFINAGVYILEPEVIARIPTDRPVSIERETYPQLIGQGCPVYGFAPLGFWLDIGRPDQYLAANAAVLSRMVRTEVPYRPIGEGVQIAPDAEVDAATCIGDGAVIESGCRLKGCVLLRNVRVGRNAALTGLIADEDTQIGDDVTSRPGPVLARGSMVARGTRL